MAARGLKQKPLAIAAGLHDTAARDILKGRSKNPARDTLIKLNAALRLPEGELIREWARTERGAAGLEEDAAAYDSPRPNAVLPPGGVPDRAPQNVLFTRDLPVRGVAQGGPDGVVNIDGEPIEWSWRPPELLGVREAYAVQIDGDSMSSTGLAHGSTVWVHPFRRPQPGNFVVLVKKAGEAFVKRYVRTTETLVVIEQTDPPKEFRIPKGDVRALHLVLGGLYR